MGLKNRNSCNVTVYNMAMDPDVHAKIILFIDKKTYLFYNFVTFIILFSDIKIYYENRSKTLQSYDIILQNQKQIRMPMYIHVHNYISMFCCHLIEIRLKVTKIKVGCS